MRSWVMLVLVAGCGRFGFDPRSDGDGGNDDAEIDAPPPPYVPNWKSGTRIKARVLRPVEGGDPSLIGWHDTLLDTDCVSQPAADGQERCLPNQLRLGRFFSDAACTQDVAFALEQICGGTDRFAIDYDVGNLGHVFPLGADYAGPLFTNDTGPCLATGATATTRVYSIGAEVPASMFVRTVYDNRIEGSWLRVYGGFEDGAEEQFPMLSLPVSGRGCRPRLGRLGEQPCREAIPSLTPVYTEASCTQRAYLSPAAITDASFYVDEPALCDQTYSRFARGTDVTAGTHWTLGPTGCASTTTPAGARMYTGTAEADPFPLGTFAISPRRGRIGKLSWSLPDGTTVEIIEFDHDLGVPCRNFRATDDKLRCLPDEPNSVPAFRTPGCVGATTNVTASCFGGGAPMHGPDYGSCRDQGFAVRGYMPMTTEPSVAVEASCRALTPTGGSFDASARVAEIPPSTFPELIETIE